MEFDLTITVTSILGIAAIISPIATSIINNRYLLKMRRLDAKIEQEKELSFYTREIFENYLKASFRFIRKPDGEAKQEYSEYYALALIYFPKNLISEIIDINKILLHSEKSAAIPKLELLSNTIREILQKP